MSVTAIIVFFIVGIFTFVLLSVRQPGPKKARSGGTPMPMTEHDATEFDRVTATFLALARDGLRGKCTDDVADFTDTRIGGALAWPKGQDRPLDEGGNPLVLLTHINLADLPAIDGLPRSGTLQVLITSNDLFGCEFPSQNGRGFVIVHHPDGTEFTEHPNAVDDGNHMPIYALDTASMGRKIAWDQVSSPPPAFDYRLADPYSLNLENSNVFEAHYENFHDEQADKRGHYDVLLLGNPDFTQDDPRSDEDLSGFVNLISFSSSGGAFMWGDAGEACVLIPPDALARFDLSKAVYNWDCY